VSALHSFYRFLLRIGAVDKDITLRVQTPKLDKPLPAFFKPHEMISATAWDNEADDPQSIRNCLIIEMLYQTGMRRAELLSLQDSDVDTNEKQIRVFGKRRKERIIPIGNPLCQMIEQYREVRNTSLGTFFVDWKKDGNTVPMSMSMLYRIVRGRMGEVTTLKKHSPHVLRHTFATAMLDNGADIRTIQQLLGHASLAATQIYTHTTFEQIRKTYQSAHPRACQSPSRNDDSQK
jgi:integrase/recombinase XerC